MLLPMLSQTLRARVSAKTEEKKLELLFLQWSEHHRKLCNFIRWVISINELLVLVFFCLQRTFTIHASHVVRFCNYFSMQVIFIFGPKVSIFTFY